MRACDSCVSICSYGSVCKSKSCIFSESVSGGLDTPRARLFEGSDDGVPVWAAVVDPGVALVSPLAGLRGGSVELPAAFPGRHKVDSVPSEDGPIGALATALQEIPNIVSIELVRIWIDSEKTADCWEEVDGGAGGVDGLSGGDLTGPPEIKSDPPSQEDLHAAVPRCHQTMGRCRMRKYQSVVFDARGFIASTTVEFPDDAGV